MRVSLHCTPLQQYCTVIFTMSVIFASRFNVKLQFLWNFLFFVLCWHIGLCSVTVVSSAFLSWVPAPRYVLKFWNDFHVTLILIGTATVRLIRFEWRSHPAWSSVRESRLQAFASASRWFQSCVAMTLLSVISKEGCNDISSVAHPTAEGDDSCSFHFIRK